MNTDGHGGNQGEPGNVFGGAALAGARPGRWRGGGGASQTQVAVLELRSSRSSTPPRCYFGLLLGPTSAMSGYFGFNFGRGGVTSRRRIDPFRPAHTRRCPPGLRPPCVSCVSSVPCAKNVLSLRSLHSFVAKKPLYHPLRPGQFFALFTFADHLKSSIFDPSPKRIFLPISPALYAPSMARSMGRRT